ncbi:PREDICTED: transcription elongation factor B polypeptide 2-like [Elephantulus edwardii]|uniref:transcription elongation factor B polypeptide 2-like n=1 Tax=Elephantulus edwardii TaxID=28737 RepID=UPI0003F07F01|nr:PREDICTED: transcription elongation factor B polypeptide 2-like [Elephantulus edwardii]
MDVFLMVRRHKTTMFINAKESSTVLELKLMIEGILQHPPEEQRLYKDGQLLDDDNMTLLECGFTSETATPHDPATVGLAFIHVVVGGCRAGAGPGHAGIGMQDAGNNGHACASLAR